jgi:hypothetical protein
MAARAAETAQVGINRSKVTHVLAPGDVAQGTIDVRNPGDSPMPISVYLRDWAVGPAGDGAKEFFPADSTPRSCAGWVTLAPSTFHLEPWASITVEYTVRVPQDASLEGGYYCSLLFEAGGTPLEAARPRGEGLSLEYTAGLSSFFSIDIKGTVRRLARLTDLTSTPPMAGRPMTVSGLFINESNAIVECTGTFHVQRADGLIAARGALSQVVLGIRQQVPIRLEWPGSLDRGQYSLILTYDCGEDLVLGEEVSLAIP